MDRVKKVAMIPARLGSQRVKRKNLRLLAGQPLISYAIRACLESEVFNEIVVNSESEEIGQIANQYGVTFHRRDRRLAEDHVKNEDFVYDFLRHYDVDYIFMVNPTSPLIKPREIRTFVNSMLEGGYDSFFSVEAGRTQTIFRAQPVNFALNEPHISSQDIEPTYLIRWAITGWKKETFVSSYEAHGCATYGGRIGTHELEPYSAVDIDYETDFTLAEALMNMRKAGRL